MQLIYGKSDRAFKELEGTCDVCGTCVTQTNLGSKSLARKAFQYAGQRRWDIELLVSRGRLHICAVEPLIIACSAGRHMLPVCLKYPDELIFSYVGSPTPIEMNRCRDQLVIQLIKNQSIKKVSVSPQNLMVPRTLTVNSDIQRSNQYVHV